LGGILLDETLMRSGAASGMTIESCSARCAATVVMTAFVESCRKTASSSAAAAARTSRGRPKARQLMRALLEKKKILLTTHEHPDPDALAACVAMRSLLEGQLGGGVEISVSIKGDFGGGLNAAFTQYSDLKVTPWDEAALKSYDAVLLLDTQPTFRNNPLPAEITAMAVIDHHRGRGRRPKCPFCDIRPDVGATSSIVFSYFMELEQKISPDLGATLLFGIESDLAGAAGQPGELDNVALSSLTLIADPQKLYRMRYVDLPQNVFISYAQGLANAMIYDGALMSHLETSPSPERPAVIADFLLRFDEAKWSLVSGVLDNQLLLSLRTYPGNLSAAQLMKRLLRNLGEGGGHRTKAGGAIPLTTGTAAEVDRFRDILRRRYLRALGIKGAKPQRLIPRGDAIPVAATRTSAKRDETPAT
jgi:nanoRNase/pAp phosphatase (c-di-AMP/oligoRNAs hydrolase)